MRHAAKKSHDKAKTLDRESWFRDKEPILRFGLKFALLVALFYGLLALPFFEGLLLRDLEANARLANALLNLFGQSTHVSGVIIESARFSMAIRRGCDAIEPTWLYCASILAFPSSLAWKALGMGTGIVLLQMLNLVRIVTLYEIGIHAPAFFNTTHLEIWPVIFILVAMGLFVGWRAGDRERS